MVGFTIAAIDPYIAAPESPHVYSLATFDDGHILLLTLNGDFDIANEIPTAFNECFELLEQGPENVVFISDARDLHIQTLNDLIQGSNMTRSPEGNKVNKHPKVRKNMTVTNSGMIQLAAKELNSASFGYLELGVFTSVEEALNDARNYLYGASKTG